MDSVIRRSGCEDKYRAMENCLAFETNRDFRACAKVSQGQNAGEWSLWQLCGSFVAWRRVMRASESRAVRVQVMKEFQDCMKKQRTQDKPTS